MKKKIHLINYGFGNPASVKNALEFLNYNCKVVDHNTNLSDITHLILPGVGSFEAGIKTLQKQKNGCLSQTQTVLTKIFLTYFYLEQIYLFLYKK